MTTPRPNLVNLPHLTTPSEANTLIIVQDSSVDQYITVEEARVLLYVPQGYSGSKGAVGYSGSAGYWGSNGYWGSVGYTGSAGYWGSVGYTGSAGYWGSVGYPDNRVITKGGCNINGVVNIFNLGITCCIFMNNSKRGTYSTRDTKGVII